MWELPKNSDPNQDRNGRVPIASALTRKTPNFQKQPCEQWLLTCSIIHDDAGITASLPGSMLQMVCFLLKPGWQVIDDELAKLSQHQPQISPLAAAVA